MRRIARVVRRLYQKPMQPSEWKALQERARHDTGDYLVPETTRAKMVEFIVMARVFGQSSRAQELMTKQYRAWRTADLRRRYRQIVIAVVPDAIVRGLRYPGA